MFRVINGALLNVVSFGPGPRTFLGAGGWTGNWELWQSPFEIMSRTWRTVSFDHRGAGESVVPVESITDEALVSDLFGVMDALEIERCVVGAESAGARTVLTAAVERPERFTGLVIVDGAWTPNDSPGPNPFSGALRAQYAAAIGAFVDNCVPDEEQAHIRRWGRSILHRAEPDAAIRLAEIGGIPDLTLQLAEVTVPALVIHSAGDRIVPCAQAERLATLLPKSELVILDGESHVPTMTDPTRIAAEIEAFAVRHGL